MSSSLDSNPLRLRLSVSRTTATGGASMALIAAISSACSFHEIERDGLKKERDAFSAFGKIAGGGRPRCAA